MGALGHAGLIAAFTVLGVVFWRWGYELRVWIYRLFGVPRPEPGSQLDKQFRFQRWVSVMACGVVVVVLFLDWVGVYRLAWA